MSDNLSLLQNKVAHVNNYVNSAGYALRELQLNSKGTDADVQKIMQARQDYAHAKELQAKLSDKLQQLQGSQSASSGFSELLAEINETKAQEQYANKALEQHLSFK